MRQPFRLMSWVLSAMLLFGMAGGDVARAETDEEREIRIGKEASAAIDKEVKLVTDQAIIDRVNRIGAELAAIAKTMPVSEAWGGGKPFNFNYTFKVIDDKDINAFSLPGGFIYINRGLIDFAESDDELAGVIAHEIAHSAHRHVFALNRKNNKLTNSLLLPLLLAIIVGQPSNEDAYNLLQGAQLYQTARINAYGQEAETDADTTGMQYMKKSNFNPVGMYTFMDRLRRQEMLRPNIDWGIFRTHPPSRERSDHLRKQLEQAKVPIRPSQTSSSLRATARPATEPAAAFEVVYQDKVLVKLADDPNEGRAEERANRMATALNEFFDAGPEMFDVRAQSRGHGITVGSRVAVELTAADAQLAGVELEKLQQQVVSNVRSAVGQYRLRRAR